MNVSPRELPFLYRLSKRAIDIAASLGSLFAFAPLLLLLAIMVRLKLGSPIFFKQERTGLGGRSFYMIKFRTMTDSRDASGTLLPDAERLPPFGKWLRSSSLDELPELWNILIGDMSLVGPRPLLPRYLPRYSPEQIRRHAVKPGLTGWAQVNGRNAQSWEERFSHDVWYVDHASLLLDISIILKTVLKVVKREGVTPEKQATMPEFMGNESREAKD